MGRPPMTLGMHGSIDFHHDDSGRVRARSRFRYYDGVCRAVTRWGGSEADASERLLIALGEQAALPAGAWAGTMRVREAVPLWLADLDAGSLAPSSRQLYAAAARLYVLPA